MNIPKIYSDILERDKYLKGVVYLAIETFGEIFSENKLYFFEEYTDHGIKHIEAVLASTADLIPSVSINEFLDPENVTVLILSVLLHDIGMHQTFETFTQLINQNAILIPELDSLTWKELWENYTEEAKKFTSQQKKEIFGEYDYVVNIPDFENANKLGNYQRKLIGEFLRRHHPRIAHEIALKGFHSLNSVIKFAENYDEEKKDIVGVVARSHGMDIRNTYQYLQNKFYRVNKCPLAIHVYYLMVIIRIADYFQVDINRLSLVSLKLKSFKSPISEIEHVKHFAIKEIREVDEDPETLFIRALPNTNSIYWKLMELISDIQNELDKSWAILGEKYGKDKIKPLIKYRRLISNLQEKSYLDSISFVPEKIFFDTDADLARLLVEPLYGNNPTYGVRELIQNAVDAIHERIFLERLDESFNSLINIDITHDSNERYFFIISDNGKGMNIKEIKNYFLKAGSTNRKSKEWDNLYLDSSRNSNLLKSGKFGVGILAAFLIGEELDIQTKRFDSKFGLKFSITINSKNVQVTKINDCAIGTRIKIPMNEYTKKYFAEPSATYLIAWDKWYILNKPVIKINSLFGFNKKYGPDHFEPSFFENNALWTEFFATGYTKLRWSYIDESRSVSGKYQLTCNGLVIPSPPPMLLGSIPPPNVQVFDFNGILPINLNRNTLDSNILPFQNELLRSIFKKILEVILTLPPSAEVSPLGIHILKPIRFPKLFGGLDFLKFFNGFVYTFEGFYIKNNYLKEVLKNYKTIRLSIYENADSKKLPIVIDDMFSFEVARISRYNNLDILGYTIETKKKSIEWAIFSNLNSDYRWFEKDTDYVLYELTIVDKQFSVVKKKSIKHLPISLMLLSALDLESIHSIICFSNINYEIERLNSEFNNYLRNIFLDLGSSVIPYSLDSRTNTIHEILKLA